MKMHPFISLGCSDEAMIIVIAGFSPAPRELRMVSEKPLRRTNARETCMT